jgi:hypothetical protein
MAQKPKRKAKAKPKPKFTDKAQSERFIEAARQEGIETVDDKFHSAVRTVLRSTPKR